MSTVHPGYNATPIPNSQLGGPAWDVAYLFPPQGQWSEDEYLRLDQRGGRIVELVHGQFRILPTPNISEHLLCQFLLCNLSDFVSTRSLGFVVHAPLPVRLGPRHYREPDVVFFKPKRLPPGKEYPELADLIIEIVSDDANSRKRDYEEKRRDYAAAGVPEYWIVDPQDQTVTVLALDEKDGGTYRLHNTFSPGTNATSVLLPGFSIDVAELFAAAKKPQ
jgi:Uma2 family endonuclease